MAIKKTIIIAVESEDIDKAKSSLDQLSSSVDTAETNANIRVDVDGTQIDTTKVSLDQMSSSLDDVKVSANGTSSSLRGVADNGGAISVLDRLTGGLATQLRDGWEASKLFNGSLKKMRGALIASGIGLFVVALALVVTYWTEIKDLVQGTTRALEGQQKALNRLIDRVNHQLSLNKLNQQILEKQGKSTVELIRVEKLLLIEKQKAIKSSLLNLKAQLEIENSKIREVGLLEKGLIHLKGYVFGYASIATDVAKAAGTDIVSDLQGQIKELEIKSAEVKLALLDDEETPKDTDEVTSGEGDDEKIVFDDSAQKKLDDEILALEELARVRQEFADKNRDNKAVQSEVERERRLLEIEKNISDEVFKRQAIEEVNKFYDSESIRIAKENADALKKIDDLKEQNNKKQLAQVGQSLSKAGKLAGEATGAGKALAIAGATISTFQTAQAAYQAAFMPVATVASPALGALFAGVAVAGGLANIASITKVKVPNEKGGTSSPSVSSPKAPSFNLVEGTSDNQINDSINLGNQEPVKAFVVSGDVTTAQSLDNNIITESGL